ncbi:MAG: TetR/AcrR family transcriptional regulator C-terminal domain-containing protein [Mesorhizobium sp.]|nr:TetR/AcrR family transcriptional regulator C-terminal domain-containing protein [Mesorhizobium sp.]MCO5164028.1 TetR/AcrR family transcriptional regulator C-terminal domain-containing protein [Mesorhizobium sp.]
MADIAFVAEHQNIPRMLLSSLGRSKQSVLRLMIATFIKRYEQRISCVIAEAQKCGEIRATLDRESAARLFIATIQNLVFHALVADEIDQLREAAPAAFASYRACVEATR